MDANQTRFHLLLGNDDWAKCTPQTAPGENSPVAWDAQRFELTLAPHVFRFQSASKNQAPSIGDRRGSASDQYNNWYWIGATEREILVRSSGSGLTTHFWSSTDDPRPVMPLAPGGFQSLEPAPPQTDAVLRGLAVNAHHYLVVGTVNPGGLFVFDLHAGGPPRRLCWPVDGAAFAPFDMSAVADGTVLILDRDNQRVWSVDRTLTAALLVADHLPLPNAIGIQALPDGTFLILDTDLTQSFSTIYRMQGNVQVGNAVSTAAAADLLDPSQRPAFRLLAQDFAFVPDPNDTLFVAASDGDQSYSFQLLRKGDALSLKALPDYLPMRLYGGKGYINAGASIYYDSRDQWVPLVAQNQPRFTRDAVLLTRKFDGKEPDCIWHRLLLDGSIPPEANVRISSRAGNDPDLLDVLPWQTEPQLYLRGDGSEQPFVRQNRGVYTGTWELLFQKASGRYLQLKLELSGNGRTTPRLRSLRAYYPRFSYLRHYVPGVYQRDASSASFLDRFLSNSEGILTTIEDKIAAAQVLFDLRSAPPETLAWLADWFGLVLDPIWDEPTQRLFLKHVMDFFQYRGTVHGVTMALRLALESCPNDALFDPNAQRRPGGVRVVEKFRTRGAASLWTPAQGADALNQLYSTALGRPVAYPVQLPSATADQAAWTAFSTRTLGFVPRVSQADLASWLQFLARRYPNVGRLNTAYLTSFASLNAVPLPATLPAQPAALTDWFDFQRIVLPMQASAHRFTVMIPVPEAEAFDLAAHQRRLDLAKRIVDFEKPAHTLYDLQFFWAFFRVGEARLGEDSILDAGSRAPRLMPPAILGQSFIASSYIAPGYPQDVTDRQIAGRDILAAQGTFTTQQEQGK
jgi:phage tail-like protein